MISCSDIQNAYISLYKQVRKYIWSYSVVECLAEIEVESFKTFSSLNKLNEYFNKFCSYAEVKVTRQDDEDLDIALNKFSKAIQHSKQYCKLFVVKEV